MFVGSANGLRRFRTQASFDVGFSTTKTILLLGCAFALERQRRVRRLRRRGGAHPGRRVARDAAAGRRRAVSDAAHRRLHGGGASPTRSLLNLALNSDLLLLRHFALSAPGVDATAAAAVAGNYEALRTFALLPYQTLLVVTFVIFPLVSRSTFAADREATRAYVTQTMRYALILAGLMGIVLAARPSALFGIIYKPEYRAGAAALPILAAGQCCLALLSVACSILNAAGRTRATLTLMVVTAGDRRRRASRSLVPRAAPGAPMLVAAATATAIATATGLVAALVVLRARLGGVPPLATVVRVALAMAAAVVAARLVPGHGKIVGLAVMALAGDHLRRRPGRHARVRPRRSRQVRQARKVVQALAGSPRDARACD